MLLAMGTPAPRPAAAGDVGGAFTLTDQDGRRVTGLAAALLAALSAAFATAWDVWESTLEAPVMLTERLALAAGTPLEAPPTLTLVALATVWARTIRLPATRMPASPASTSPRGVISSELPSASFA